MKEHDSNENEARGRTVPDAHGHAAILLVESLVHGLVARSIISVEDAVSIVDTAAEVKEALAQERDDSLATIRASVGILQRIRASLAIDL